MNVVKLKRSAVPGAMPEPEALELGEIAVNVSDGVLYIKLVDGRVITVGNAPQTVPFDLAWSFSGKPNGVLFRYVFARAVTFPVGMAGSQGVAETAFGRETVLDLRRNGVAIGTVTFAANATVATFTGGFETRFGIGDVLTVTGQSSTHPNTIACTLVGVR